LVGLLMGRDFDERGDFLTAVKSRGVNGSGGWRVFREWENLLWQQPKWSNAPLVRGSSCG